jgi:hypothetical protein
MLREKLHWGETPEPLTGNERTPLPRDAPKRRGCAVHRGERFDGLRLLSIRNFVVVDALELELDAASRAHRRDRRRQVDPARCAGDSCWATASSSASCVPAPSAPSSPPSSIATS